MTPPSSEAPALLAATGSFDPQGPVARAMEDLWWLMLWLGVAAFALFTVLLVAALFGRAPAAAGAKGVRRWIVGGGVVQPLVLITVVFAATLVAMRATPESPPEDALVVDVVGRQFDYEIAYPEQGVSGLDELHIPVGRPVALRLTSEDVIHSFWVPELGGKLDMLPDGSNTLVLQADEPGRHVARCAEFCGLEHTRMQLTVVAEPEEDFEAWLGAQR